MQLQDEPESWPVRRTEQLHRDEWVVGLRGDDVVQPDGGTVRRLVLEHPGAVIVLAVDDEERVFCLRQYRHPAGRRFVELPAGVLDAGPGEAAIEAARRELREEAQLEASRWEPLLTVYSSPGISAERMQFFVAQGLSAADRGGFRLEHEEADMETGWVPFDDLLHAVVADRVQDAPLVLAVLAWDRRRRARGAVVGD
ncbi:MAG: NUDIX domain-containing protein [Nocardioidaceae bacterium]